MYFDNMSDEIFAKLMDRYINSEYIINLKQQLFNMDGLISYENHEKELEELGKKHKKKIAELEEIRSKEQAALKEQYNIKLAALEAEINKLKQENTDIVHKCSREIKAIENEAMQKVDSLTYMVNTLKQEKIEQQKLIEEKDNKIKSFSDKYDDFEKIYKKYKELPDTIRNGLAAAFSCGDDFKSFLFGAVQESHLDSVWKYISYVINSRQVTEEQAEILNELFEFAFHAIEQGNRNPDYALIKVAVGDNFSPLNMGRVEGSKQQGYVSKQWLAGYCYRTSGKTVNPALVMIE